VTGLRIGLLGTRGIPAAYGGFETAVEEVGARLAEAGHEVLVYSRQKDGPKNYRGMHSVYLPTLRTKYTDTLVHGAVSTAHALVRNLDVALVFNAANAPAASLLALRRIPYALNVDGLEWKRSKWSGSGKRYYLACERIAVRTATRLVADSRAIADYYEQRYGCTPVYIPYGAPARAVGALGRLSEVELTAGGYHLSVARFEPENNVEVIVRGYTASRAKLPLVVVGGGPYSARYTDAVHAAAGGDPRVRFAGSVWDQELLDALYAGALTYLHGHSVGGTNPSLLRAAGGTASCIAYDVPFNREVAGDEAGYFATADDLAAEVEAAEADPAATRERGASLAERVQGLYDWDDVAGRYERLCSELVGASAEVSVAELPAR
jgi:glycosyltransferase involved in cell wall biosynthesis